MCMYVHKYESITFLLTIVYEENVILFSKSLTGIYKNPRKLNCYILQKCERVQKIHLNSYRNIDSMVGGGINGVIQIRWTTAGMTYCWATTTCAPASTNPVTIGMIIVCWWSCCCSSSRIVGVNATSSFSQELPRSQLILCCWGMKMKEKFELSELWKLISYVKQAINFVHD